MGKSNILRKRLRSNFRAKQMKFWTELEPREIGNFCYISTPEWFNMKAKKKQKRK